MSRKSAYVRYLKVRSDPEKWEDQKTRNRIYKARFRKSHNGEYKSNKDYSRKAAPAVSATSEPPRKPIAVPGIPLSRLMAGK